MLIETLAGPWQRWLDVNSSEDAFALAPVARADPPVLNTLQLAQPTGGGVVQNTLKVTAFGFGAATNAFSVRIYMWARIGSGPRPGVLWFPVPLCTLGFVLGTQTGVSGSPVLVTERFADQVTVTMEETVTADVTRTGTVGITTPAANDIAHARVPLQGGELLTASFDQTVGTPTMNLLYCLM